MYLLSGNSSVTTDIRTGSNNNSAIFKTIKKGVVMCHFPSWIETAKEVIFLVDKDVENEGFNFYDAVGHGALRSVFPGIGGVNKERFPCHPLVAAEIRKGKMKRLMQAGGYKEVHVNSKGQLHRIGGPATVTTYGYKTWYKNGKYIKEEY